MLVERGSSERDSLSKACVIIQSAYIREIQHISWIRWDQTKHQSFHISTYLQLFLALPLARDEALHIHYHTLHFLWIFRFSSHSLFSIINHNIYIYSSIQLWWLNIKDLFLAQFRNNLQVAMNMRFINATLTYTSNVPVKCRRLYL